MTIAKELKMPPLTALLLLAVLSLMSQLKKKLLNKFRKIPLNLNNSNKRKCKELTRLTLKMCY